MFSCLNLIVLAAAAGAMAPGAGAAPLWAIGHAGGGPKQFALAPAGYGDFLRNFGRRDHAYYIGLSDPKSDWPYVLPGPLDTWAGSHYNPKSHNEWDQMNTLPIGFVLSRTAGEGSCVLILNFADASASAPPRLIVTVNGAEFERELAAGNAETSLRGNLTGARAQTARIAFPASLLRAGYNEVALRSLQGHGCLFDSIALEAPPGMSLAPPSSTVIRSIETAGHAVSSLPSESAAVRIEYYHQGPPATLKVQAGRRVLRLVRTEDGLHTVESPAAPSSQARIGIWQDGSLLADAELALPAGAAAEPSDYVNVFAGTAHSRWMIAPGPWMPFGMVKLAPDNQEASWCAGYDYGIRSIDCFSHIHEFTMAGLGMMPTVGPLRTHEGLEGDGFSSRIDKRTEHGGIGWYAVRLEDSGIGVELTATTRASLQRYRFPESDQARVLYPFLLPNEYEMHVLRASVRRTAPDEIEGEIACDIPRVYDCDQHYVLHFVSQFNRPFRGLGGWENLPGASVTIPRGYRRPVQETEGWSGGEVAAQADRLDESGDCGAFVTFSTRANESIEVRTGLSLVSTANARLNLEEELAKPFGWNFDAVVRNQRRTWDRLFHRVDIETQDAREKTRFYTNLYRALSGRTVWSDVNGQWIDPQGRVWTAQSPDGIMLGSDAFWGSYWNLNPLMNLLAPEWSRRWVGSEMEMYRRCGWLAKGPAGLQYISVMVAEHEIPLLVAACQSGLPGIDRRKVLEAAVKMQDSPRVRIAGGGRAGNENLPGYLRYGYVPADGPLRGNVSNTCEYAYDDWAVAQLARGLGRKDIAERFLRRSQSWRNVFDPASGFIRPKRADGSWVEPFDPYRTKGYTEGNAWQYTWFVPQDVPGLVAAMGRDRFVSRLNHCFEVMAPTRFNAAGGLTGQYPIDQGNEPTMQVSWLFDWAGRPWLTQKWTRAILDSYYGYNPADAYPGDEDQGQMSSWFVLSALGLFQTDGGCAADPVYELASPLYPKATLHLEGNRTLVIEAKNASPENRYIQSATFNGQPLESWWLSQAELMKGGTLLFVLGPDPNERWAAAAPPPPAP